MLIQKRYYKFQNMLADLGGLLKGLMSIATFINYYFCNDLYYSSIINPNINSLIEGNHINSKNTSIKISKFQQLTNNVFTSNSNFNNVANIKNLNSNIGLIKEKYSKFDLNNLSVKNEKEKKHSPTNGLVSNEKGFKKKEYEFHFLGLICPSLCFSKSSKFYSKLSEHSKFKQLIRSQFDVINLFNKMNTIDKINIMLLGSENKYLIENCANPLDYIEENKNLNKMEINFVTDFFIDRVKNYTKDS
jgi:hypothetical protein